MDEFRPSSWPEVHYIFCCALVLCSLCTLYININVKKSRSESDDNENDEPTVIYEVSQHAQPITKYIYSCINMGVGPLARGDY